MVAQQSYPTTQTMDPTKAMTVEDNKGKILPFFLSLWKKQLTRSVVLSE